MKLINCHIENFGKLSDCTIDFSEGVNRICEENGWGKSTLAAFIRAMFYGLEGERKRNIEENERKRYMPWQGGVFGGQLTFETNGKQYTVTRTFHDQDEFELRDAKTNLISQDYSSKLGEELFQVNRESFMRTVFIGQDDCETTVTDDVNAKIGNLAENANDLNSYEATNTRLKELLNSLTPNRKTGSISQRKNEITELERKVAVGNRIPDALQTAQDKRQEEIQKNNVLKLELEAVQKEWMRVTELQTILGKKEQWENLKQGLKDTGEIFSGKVPEMDMVETAQANCSMMEKAAERRSTYEMTEREKEQLVSLQTVFDKVIPSEHDFAEQFGNVQRLEKVRKELLQAQMSRVEEKVQTKPSTIGLVLGVFLIVAGLVAAGMTGGISLILSVVGALTLLVTTVRNKKNLADATQEPLENVCAPLLQEAEQLQQLVRTFLEKFGIYAEEDAFVNHLHELKTKVFEYEFLDNKRQQFMKANAEFECYHNQILDFLLQYGFEPAHHLQLQLMKIRDAVQGYTDAYKKLKAFEQGTDLAVLNVEYSDTRTVSLAELKDKLSVLSKTIETSNQLIKGYNTDLEVLQAQYEEWEENKSRLIELKCMQEQELQKYQHILKVQEYLGRAKESITNRYSRPILESFKKYFELITDMSAEEFHIDANIQITKHEQGKQRETNTLSLGYRDLIGICLRFALVDAMYQDEKPVLILDDPFINLDDAKLKAVKTFLEHVAQKYQIIYFTCSETRS